VAPRSFLGNELQSSVSVSLKAREIKLNENIVKTEQSTAFYQISRVVDRCMELHAIYYDICVNNMQELEVLFTEFVSPGPNYR
jgi:hypothetical protein